MASISGSAQFMSIERYEICSESITESVSGYNGRTCLDEGDLVGKFEVQHVILGFRKFDQDFNKISLENSWWENRACRHIPLRGNHPRIVDQSAHQSQGKPEEKVFQPCINTKD
jgi:hypothetical protein